MQLHNFSRRRLIGAAALACAAALIPAGALAATAGSPATQARSAHPVTAYVTTGSAAVPINTVTNTAGMPIKFGSGAACGGSLIDVTPNGKTVYAESGNTVVPIRTATNKAGDPVEVGPGPAHIVFTPDSKKAYVTNDGCGRRSGTR
jgi:DNA-binding beta-propeller fold protein YncE